MANQDLLDWFDGLETVLDAESKLSGLLKHRSTIGSAREFLVSRILKTLLPSNIHIGSGKVIDSFGRSSRQIDIVLYDPRFPMMRVQGGGLYFVEGVIATIEVKSTINKTTMIESLENCKSVLELQVNGVSKGEALSRVKYYMETENISMPLAEHRFNYRILPATFVFSFTSTMRLETAANCIKSWWEGYGCGMSAYFPVLPRVITVGHIVGVTNDGRYKLDGSDNKAHVMAIFKTDRRFRWFAVSLMDAVSQRLGVKNEGESFTYDISKYYPFDKYVEDMEGERVLFLRHPL